MQMMEWDLGINKGKGKGRGKGKGKGKGETKGKGAAKGEGKAKGKGKANPVSPSSRLPASSSCTRCGKDGHAAVECFHKDKMCDNCGKKGHLKAVCWLESQAAAREEPKPPTTTRIAPWTCFNTECFATHEDPYLKKCPKCKTVRIHPNSERDEKEETEKTMIAKNIVSAMEGGDGEGKKGDSGDGQTEDKEEKEELSNLEKLITSAKTFGMLSTVKEAEEKKEAILKKKREREPTAMSTTKTAKDVLAEKNEIAQAVRRPHKKQLRQE
jgi:hypothetical protein